MQYLQVEMPDQSKWLIPVSVIAEHRAKHYCCRFGDDLQRSLEDTLLVFEDGLKIKDWAESNMNWKDVKTYALRLPSDSVPDFQEGWVNGPKIIVEKEGVVIGWGP